MPPCQFRQIDLAAGPCVALGDESEKRVRTDDEHLVKDLD
jgi:hypothetical protein